jgi:hypothetical protein
MTIEPILAKRDMLARHRLPVARPAPPLYWLDDPDCIAMCEDLASLCQELARTNAPAQLPSATRERA